MEKVGEGMVEFVGTEGGKCINCSCFHDVVINQIIGLHGIEVSSHDCCHYLSNFMAKMHQILSGSPPSMDKCSCHLFGPGWN